MAPSIFAYPTTDTFVKEVNIDSISFLFLSFGHQLYIYLIKLIISPLL